MVQRKDREKKQASKAKVDAWSVRYGITVPLLVILFSEERGKQP